YHITPFVVMHGPVQPDVIAERLFELLRRNAVRSQMADVGVIPIESHSIFYIVNTMLCGGHSTLPGWRKCRGEGTVCHATVRFQGCPATASAGSRNVVSMSVSK